MADRYEADVYFVDFRGLGSSNPLFVRLPSDISVVVILS
jgi:hypothetical protein